MRRINIAEAKRTQKERREVVREAMVELINAMASIIIVENGGKVETEAKMKCPFCE